MMRLHKTSNRYADSTLLSHSADRELGDRTEPHWVKLPVSEVVTDYTQKSWSQV